MNDKQYTSDIVFDKAFQKIMGFYLIECPVEGASHRGVLFKDLGWRGASRFRMLERLLKAASGMNDEQWSILEKPSEVRSKSENTPLADQFIFSDQSKGRVPTFIYSIRNALAHGAFDIMNVSDKRYYYFENEYRGNLRSKMLLPEDTLIEWIKIIRTRPEYLTKKAKRKS